MKKVLILLAFIPFLFGCEEFFVYEEISEPNLTGGAWTFVDYDIQVISSIAPVEVILNDTICINAFGLQEIVDGEIVMKQNFDGTSADRRLIKRQTLWDFDDSSFSLYINGDYDHRFPVTYPKYMMTEYTQMEVTNPFNGSVSNYTFHTNAMGMNYPTKLTLTSPNIVTDLYLSSGMRDKAVTVSVTLVFTRN